MESLSPYEVAALRMASAGLVLLPFAVSAIKQVPRDKILMVILSGILGSFFPAFLFCIAETKIDTSLAGILNALTPLFTIVIGIMFFKSMVSRQKLLGVIVGFIGLCLLFVSRGDISLSYLGFSSLVLVATIFYGINVNIIGKHMNNIGSLNIASLAFGFLIFPSVMVLWFAGFFARPMMDVDFLRATSASVVLGVFGTAIASVLFYMLVKRAGSLFSSTVTYGIPVIAVFWGLWDGEHISLLQVACLGVILVGVYLANKPNKNPGTL